MAVFPGPNPAQSVTATGSRFWQSVRDEIMQAIAAVTQPTRYRTLAINVPLVGDTASGVTPAGWVASVGVAFNCRIVGYQIFALLPGTVTVDIQRTTPITILETDPPTPVSIVGDPSLYPTMNGAFVENFDMSGWTATELADGDQLHFFLTADTDASIATLVLRLQDLDEKVQ
jgi:hypothetical protein